MLFLESFINHKSNVSNGQVYIKENFNIDSEYNEDTNTLHIFCKNANESLNLAAAKEYLLNTIDETMITIKYGF